MHHANYGEFSLFYKLYDLENDPSGDNLNRESSGYTVAVGHYGGFGIEVMTTYVFDIVFPCIPDDNGRSLSVHSFHWKHQCRRSNINTRDQ